MAKESAAAAPGLSLPRATFAKLTPAPFLHAHLKHPQPIRPSGRRVTEFREPLINTGSLTHSNGSAVVRLGDTAVVCGVRGEILHASDIPHPPKDDVVGDDLTQRLGLLIPNLELSTGCSPAHLPGNPPSGLAQSLSWRIYSLLHASNLISAQDLEVRFTPPSVEGEDIDEEPQAVVKAYWTLYIDILCISLDGNCFDAAWIAILAALRGTRLPKANWDPDSESVLCSPLASEASLLPMKVLPTSATFVTFSTASPLKQPETAENWILADPDAFEEEICRESVTIVVDENSIIRIEKNGGAHVGKQQMAQLVKLANDRRTTLLRLLGS